MAIRQVFSRQSTSANGIPMQVKSTYQGSVHVVTFLLRGTPAGASAKLQIGVTSGDTGWVDLPDSVLSVPGAVNVELANGYWVRPVLASTSTVGTSCDAFLGGGVYTR